MVAASFKYTQMDSRGARSQTRRLRNCKNARRIRCRFTPNRWSRQGKVSFNDRPHPGPLLQGEGETVAAVLEIPATGFERRSLAITAPGGARAPQDSSGGIFWNLICALTKSQFAGCQSKSFNCTVRLPLYSFTPGAKARSNFPTGSEPLPPFHQTAS